jgi:RHS repeat-associated protein
VNLTDGVSHQVGLYALDWDNLGRQERVEILDATTNAVLDSRDISSFANGKYLVWELKGHVKLKVTKLAGTNAVISGLFFEADNNASFITTDTTTQGNWKGTYGSDGYNVVNDAASYPSYATVSVSGQSAYSWNSSTTDARALLKAASTTDRIAACWYSYTNFTIDVNLTDGNTHKVAVYLLDWENAARNSTIEVLDATSNAVLDTRNLSSYAGGKYLVWNLHGHVKLKLSHVSPTGLNAVLSGLFFDSVGGGSSSAQINWLVTDQLGTPRLIFDQTGSLASTKRHDYLPFGEELFAGTGGRTTAQGYTGDSVRQKFTRKERDIETGLDYFGARYYASMQGRFTSVDALLSSGIPGEPQSWNRYSDTINNPLKYIDPTGLIWVYLDSADGKSRNFRWYDDPNDVPKGWTEYTGAYYDGADGRYYLNPKGPAGWFDAGSNQGNGGQGLFTINTDPYVRNGWAKGPTPEQYAAYMRSGAVEDASWDIVALFLPGKIGKEGVEAALTAKAVREAAEAIPMAANPRLQRTIEALFQASDKIPGGTAGAIRHELGTGELVGGTSHIIKGEERIRNLQRIMREEKLSPADRGTAQRLMHDLQTALKGK